MQPSACSSVKSLVTKKPSRKTSLPRPNSFIRGIAPSGKNTRAVPSAPASVPAASLVRSSAMSPSPRALKPLSSTRGSESITPYTPVIPAGGSPVFTGAGVPLIHPIRNPKNAAYTYIFIFLKKKKSFSLPPKKAFLKETSL